VYHFTTRISYDKHSTRNPRFGKETAAKHLRTERIEKEKKKLKILFPLLQAYISIRIAGALVSRLLDFERTSWAAVDRAMLDSECRK
jgi:hypothetical protein